MTWPELTVEIKISFYYINIFKKKKNKEVHVYNLFFLLAHRFTIHRFLDQKHSIDNTNVRVIYKVVDLRVFKYTFPSFFIQLNG